MTYIDFDRKGLIRTLSDQFSSRFTFLAEALQNSRRSGAHRIDIIYDPDIHALSIIDDGAGISDLDAFFCIGKSGWNDPELIARENPFGIGAMSMICVADWLVIKSGSLNVSFDPKRALDGVMIPEAHSSCIQPGTCITLHLPVANYSRNVHEWKYRIIELISGFSIRVFFNGEEIPRKNSTDTRTWLVTPIGKVLAPDLKSNKNCSHVSGLLNVHRCYLQGFRVNGLGSSGSMIVHLDPSIARARVPDRDQLIDADTLRPRIETELQGVWRDALLLEKHQMSRYEFAYSYWRVCVASRNSDLLNDCPVPGSAIFMYEEPASEDVSQICMWKSGEEIPNPEHLASPVYHSAWDDSEIPGGLVSTYMMEANIPFLDGNWPHDHPIQSRNIHLQSDDFQFEIIPENAKPITSFRGQNVWVSILCCDRYEITVSQKENPLTEYSLPPSASTDSWAVYDIASETLYVPRNYRNLRNALLQISDYCLEGDIFQESLLDADCSLLEAQLNSAFCSKADDYIRHILSSGSNIADVLRDRRFTLSFVDGNIYIEEVAA